MRHGTLKEAIFLNGSIVICDHNKVFFRQQRVKIKVGQNKHFIIRESNTELSIGVCTLKNMIHSCGGPLEGIGTRVVN